MTPKIPVPISATLDMAAPPERVWAVVSDLVRMPEFSPEVRKVILVGSPRSGAGGGLGQRLIGINRRKAVWWPTSSKVVRWEPGRAVAWRTAESGATWIYEIEPTRDENRTTSRVTARRVLSAFTLGSKVLTPVLGGAIGHDHELAAGLATTLERIRAVVES